MTRSVIVAKVTRNTKERTDNLKISLRPTYVPNCSAIRYLLNYYDRLYFKIICPTVCPYKWNTSGSFNTSYIVL